MYAEKHRVTLTTATGGAATEYTPNVTGRILGVNYIKAGSGGFSDGVGATITLEATGEAILTTTNMNSSAKYRPRPPVQDESGADATLDGTRKLREPIVAVNDRVKIVIASGGDAKVGTFDVIVG